MFPGRDHDTNGHFCLILIDHESLNPICRRIASYGDAKSSSNLDSCCRLCMLIRSRLARGCQCTVCTAPRIEQVPPIDIRARAVCSTVYMYYAAHALARRFSDPISSGAQPESNPAYQCFRALYIRCLASVCGAQDPSRDKRIKSDVFVRIYICTASIGWPCSVSQPSK